MARSLLIEPSRSTTEPIGRPSRPLRATSTATRSPSTAPPERSAGIAISRPSCFLSTGTSLPPPPGSPRKMPSTRCLARSKSFMTRAVVSSSLLLLDAQQRAVADAGDFARARPARHDDADDRRRAVGGLVPFGRPRQKFAVGIAAGDVGEHNGRQSAGIVQALAQTIDLACVGKLAQHAIERGAVGVLGAKRARDLARANLAAALTDKGDKLLAGGQAGVFHLKFFGPLIGLVRRPISATRKTIRPLPWAACVCPAVCRRRAFSTTL